MRSDMVLVLLRTGQDGEHDYRVLRPERREGGFTLEWMSCNRYGIMGAAEALMADASETRCIILDTCGPLPISPLADLGEELAFAWTYAVSPYHLNRGREGDINGYREGCVLNTTKGEYLAEHGFRDSLLPYLLFVGPKCVCDHPLAGRWALDSLCWCHTPPRSEDGYKDVSEYLEEL